MENFEVDEDQQHLSARVEFIDQMAALYAQGRQAQDIDHGLRESMMVDALSEMRRAADITQAELARRMSILGFPMQQSTIAKLERHDRPLRLSEFFAMCALLNVPPVALIAGPRLAETTDDESWLDQTQQELVAAIARKQEAETRFVEALNQHGRQYAQAEVDVTLLSAQIKHAGINATREARGSDANDG